MIDLPDTERREQFIPTDEQAQYFLNALSEEHILYHAFYVLAIYTGCRRGELCALRWSDFSFVDHYTWNLVVSRSRSVVPGKGVLEGPTKNGRSRSMTISYYVVSTLWSLYDFQKRMARENNRKVSPYLFANAQGEPVHPDTFTKHLRKIFQELGFSSSFICIRYATILSPPCSTREWTNTPLRSWQATGTPLSWRGHTAIPR